MIYLVPVESKENTWYEEAEELPYTDEDEKLGRMLYDALYEEFALYVIAHSPRKAKAPVRVDPRTIAYIFRAQNKVVAMAHMSNETTLYVFNVDFTEFCARYNSVHQRITKLQQWRSTDLAKKRAQQLKRLQALQQIYAFTLKIEEQQTQELKEDVEALKEITQSDKETVEAIKETVESITHEEEKKELETQIQEKEEALKEKEERIQELESKDAELSDKIGVFDRIVQTVESIYDGAKKLVVGGIKTAFNAVKNFFKGGPDV